MSILILKNNNVIQLFSLITKIYGYFMIIMCSHYVSDEGYRSVSEVAP